MRRVRSRTENASEPAVASPPGTEQNNNKGDGSGFELKSRIHRQLIERIDLSKLDSLPPETVQQQLRRLLEDLLAGEETPLSRLEREQLGSDGQHETCGLGPIEPLRMDPTVSDILVNGPYNVYVERRGKIERADIIFWGSAPLLPIIQRNVLQVG